MGRTRLVLLLASAALLVAPCAAVASGSGGMGGGTGGDMSSSGASSPRIDPNAAYQAGVAALNAHEYGQAIDHFRDAQHVVPRDPTVNYALGLAYVGAESWSNARRALERAVADATAPPDAHLQLGLVYLHLQNRAKAEAERATLADLIARCDAACGDTRRAQLSAAHDALDHALTGDDAAAPAAWNFPSVNEGRVAYAAAVGLINTARYQEALDDLDIARAAIGPHPDVLNYQGFASRKLHRYDAALGYYHEALAINPQHLGATEYLGELYLELGRTGDARRQLARLDHLCAFGCAQREELSRWIEASNQ
jgi:tetratricopeptide (TPR) repeat protein